MRYTYCPFCNEYYDSDVWSEHKHDHNSKIKGLRIISRFASSKKEIEKFRKLVPARIVAKITNIHFDTGEYPFFPDDYPKIMESLIKPSNLLRCKGKNDEDENAHIIIIRNNHLHRVPFSSDDGGILHMMWESGYLSKDSTHSLNNYDHYYFTTKGFEALAGCLECDLICSPKDDKRFLFQNN